MRLRHQHPSNENNRLPRLLAYVSNLDGCSWVPALASLLHHQQCQLPIVCLLTYRLGLCPEPRWPAGEAHYAHLFDWL